MFNLAAVRRWNRRSATGSASSDPRKGLTRRQVLSVGAAGAGGALPFAAFGAAPAPITRTSFGVLVQVDGLYWELPLAAFGPSARFDLRPQTEDAGPFGFDIKSATWPGTAFSQDLSFNFSKPAGAAWRIRAASDKFGAAPQMDAARFLEKGVRFFAKPADAKAIISALGWRTGGAAPTEIRLAADGSWSLPARAVLLNAADFIEGDRLRIDVRAPGNSLASEFAHKASGWTTEAVADGARLRKKATLACGGLPDGRMVELEMRRSTSATAITSADGVRVTVLVGPWRMEFRTTKGRSGGFESVNGLVLLGDEGQKRTIAANLPLANEEHRVTVGNANVALAGQTDAHRIELTSSGGRVERCEVRGLVASIYLPMKGADECRVDFDGDEFAAVYDDRPRPDDLATLIQAVVGDKWWVPLSRGQMKVTRANDLLSLTYRFTNLVLVRRSAGWRFEILDPKVAEVDVPRIIAEFPPQHVMERAFFRQIKPLAAPIPIDTARLRGPGGRPLSDAEAKELVLRRVDADRAAIPAGEEFVRVVEARAAKPSRLAFKVPLGRRRKPSLRLSLESLTAFENWELVVPGAARVTTKSPESNQVVDDWRLTLEGHDVTKGSDRAVRIAQVLANVSVPAPDVTAIEVPARLVLSPDQRARFTAKGFGQKSFRRDSAPLWTVRLMLDQEDGATGAAAGQVRAVYSPDFEHAAFEGKGKAPQQSHEAPWSPQGARRTMRTSLSSADRHELVALSSLHGLPVLPRLPVAESASPAEEGRYPGGVLAPADWQLQGVGEQGLYLPPPMTVRELSLTAIGASLDVTARFEPPAAPYTKGNALLLRAPEELFDALNIEGWDHRVAFGRDVVAVVNYKGFLFPFGIRATLVKQTERRFFAAPGDTGPTAYLIQRYFIRISEPHKQYPKVGHPFDARDLAGRDLSMRTRQTPDILDPHGKVPAVEFDDAPEGTVRLHRPNGTPSSGLVFWPRVTAGRGGEVRFEIEAIGEPGTMSVPLLFLDNTAAHAPDTVARAVEYYENIVKPETGLKTGSLDGGARRYAPERQPGTATFETARWVMGVRGRIDRPGDPYRMDATMEGADQPPFYPYVREAHVKLRSIQRFTGRADNWAVVSFDDLYTRAGLDQAANPAQVFLSVHGYLPKTRASWFGSDPLEPVRINVTGVGERSGGIGQPNQLAVALSLSNGPIGGPAAPPRLLLIPRPTSAGLLSGASQAPQRTNAARAGVFDPADFFPSDARLLGLLSLRDVVKAALYTAAPKLIETVRAADDEIGEQLDLLKSTVRPIVELMDQAVDFLATDILAMKPDPRLPAVGQMYPRLGGAVTALGTATERLRLQVSTGGGIQTLLDLVGAAQATNAAAADVLAEFDRVCQRPLPADFDELIAPLLTLASNLRSHLDWKGVQEELARTLAGPLRAQIADARNRVWLAAAMGPTAYETLQEVSNLTLDEVVRRLAETAGEAICAETLGRPVLDAVAALDEMARLLSDGAGADARVVIMRSLELVERLMGGAQAALRGPLALAGGAAEICRRLSQTASGFVGQSAPTATALEAVLVGLSGIAPVLARLSTVEAELARSIAAMGAEDDWRPTAQAALELVTKLRSGVAGAVDRLADAQERLKVTVDGLRKAAAAGCNTDGGVLLGALTRWTNERLRLLDDANLVIQRVLSALATPLPTIPTGKPDRYKIEAQLVAALDGAKQLFLGKANEKRLLDLVAGVVSAVETAAGTDTVLEGEARAIAAHVGATAKAEIDSAIGAYGAGRAELAKQLSTARATLDQTIDGNPVARATALIAALAPTSRLTSELERFAREAERRLIGAVFAPAAALVQETGTALEADARSVLRSVLTPLHTLHAKVGVAWDAVTTMLQNDPVLTERLGWMVKPELWQRLFAPGNSSPLRAAFAAQADEIKTALSKLEAANPGAADFEAVMATVRAWQGRIAVARSAPEATSPTDLPAIYALAREMLGIVDSITHGRLTDLIDFGQARRRVEQALLNLVLPDLNIGYVFDTKVNALPPFFRMEKESNERDLSLRFSLDVSLKNGPRTTMRSEGRLEAFQIHIPTIVTLRFDPVTFRSENGGQPEFDIRVSNTNGVTLGSAVSFISKLSEYLGLDGTGFFIDLRFNPPGVEAGFAFDLGTISIGSVSFINVALGASVELPFDNRAAVFRFYLARRSAPFLISAAPFGGGGFLSVAFDAKGIVGFEASFEYGGVAAFGFGPLRGQGRVTTGIYIARAGSATRVSGFFVAAGSARIACFGIGASLLVSVEQEGGGRMRGHATYTFSFSLGIRDLEYSVPVDRLIPQGWGGGGQSSASANSAAIIPPAKRQAVAPDAPRVQTIAKAMNEDWDEYQSYFDEDL